MKPTMDFFQHQEDAQRQTRRLVLLFIAAVVMVVLAVNLAVLAIFFGAEMKAGVEEPLENFRPDVLVWVTLGTLAVMTTGSLFKVAQLSGGGETVAQLLGGRPVDPATIDGDERRLLNVVEEMALASGTPVPTVYVLDKEPGVNAFAAGFSPQRSVVAVTRGTLERLNRDELQGVIAHEFSHILNGDTRLNLKLMGIVHGILVIGLIGYWILRSGAGSSSGSRKKGGGGGIVLLGLALLVIGYVGVFFGKLIKSAVSRQREFLADASAVQFTRNPDGIAGALKKIGALSTDGKESGSRLRSPNAEQASHLFFGNGVGKSLFAWLETHPPLAERIKRLDPSFDGTFPKLAPTAAEERAAAARQPAKPAAAAARGPIPIPMPAGEAFGGARAIGGAIGGAAAAVLAGAAALAGGGGAGGGAGTGRKTAATRALDPDDVTSTVGSPTAHHLAYIATLMDSLPPDLARGAREPSTARAVVAALLLDRDPAIRRRQLDLVAATGDAALDESVRRLADAAQGCPTEARLPLIDLAVPALRRLSPRQYLDFKALIEALTTADDHLSLFEFTLRHLLLRHLEPTFKKRPQPTVQYYSLAQLGGEIAVLLSALAWSGVGAGMGAATGGEADAEGERAAAGAFAAGLARLAGALDPSARLALLPGGECGLDRLDAGLEKLAATAPRLRQQLLAAAAAAIAHDGRVTLDEGELLRAVGDALDCPLPPLLPGETVASAAG